MEKVKILLVDDDSIFLKMVKIQLETIENSEVKAFSNPVEALEYVKENKVDIMFVDYFMPEMTGEDLITKIREFNQTIIIILQTGYSDQKPPLEMLDKLNIQAYFDKTKDIEDFEMLVKSTIKIHNLIELVSKQEKEIDVLKTKDEFMGSLIVGISENLKMQNTKVNMAFDMLKGKLEKKKMKDCNEYINIVKNSLQTTNKTLASLDFNTLITHDLDEVFETIKSILNVKLLIENVTIKYDIKSSRTINCKSNILIILILEILVYLADTDKNIKVETIDTNENVEIAISYTKTITEDMKKLINKIILEEENIQVNILNDNISIQVKCIK